LPPEKADSELREKIAKRVTEDALAAKSMFLEETAQTTIFDVA
jgi:hypothetical protein